MPLRTLSYENNVAKLNPSRFNPRGLPRLPSFRRKPEPRETDWIPCQARNDIRYPAACGGGVYWWAMRDSNARPLVPETNALST